MTHFVIEDEDRPKFTVQDIPLFLLADSNRRESIRKTMEDERMKRILAAEAVWKGLKLTPQSNVARRKDEPRSYSGPKGVVYRGDLYTMLPNEISISEAAKIAKTLPSHFKKKMVAMGFEVRHVILMVPRQGGGEARGDRDICYRNDAQVVINYYHNLKRRD